MPSKSLWERLFPKPEPPEERPSHTRRLQELEARCDDLEGEVEKIGRAMRTWMGRMAKREAHQAVVALEGTDGAPAGDPPSEGLPGPDIQRLSKEQVRQMFARGQLRKLGA